MAYTAAFKLTRKSKTVPFFGEWIASQPKSAAQTAYTTVAQARARAGFKQSITPEANGLAITLRYEYGSEEICKAFLAKYAAEMVLIKKARADYESKNGMTRTFSVEK